MKSCVDNKKKRAEMQYSYSGVELCLINLPKVLKDTLTELLSIFGIYESSCTKSSDVICVHVIKFGAIVFYKEKLK